MTASRPSGPRGMIIVAVLFVVVIATLVGYAGMYAAESGLDTARASISAAQSRALAWSGVQAVMAELGDQRAAVIEGRNPTVTAAWELFKGQGGGRMIVRLVAVNAAGETLESESAKLDVNTASAEMLAKVPGMTEDLAKAVVAARAERPFLSIADLARVKGMASSPGTGQPSAGGGGTKPRESFLTALSFEPSIQYGAGPNGADHRGVRRVDVNLGYSEELGTALERRLGAKDAGAYKKLLQVKEQIKTRAGLLAAARGAGMGPDQWPVLLDLFEAGPDPFIEGRVDVNRAPAEVLACIPGFDAERAARVVQSRESASAGSRTGVQWLLDQGLLSPEQFVQAADYLAPRSYQWRVMVEAGVAQDDEESRSRPLADLTLDSRSVLEAVIDIASERPRVAYLRDITLKDAADQLEAAPLQEHAEEPPPSASEAAAPEPPAPASPPPKPSSLPTFGDLHLGSGAKPAPSGPPAPPPPPPKLEPVDRRLGRWTAGPQGGSP